VSVYRSSLEVVLRIDTVHAAIADETEIKVDDDATNKATRILVVFVPNVFMTEP
jgi:hypothetical protein